MDDRRLLPPAPWLRVLVDDDGAFHALPSGYSRADAPEAVCAACGYAGPDEWWPSGTAVVRLDAALRRGLEPCSGCLLGERYGPPRCRLQTR